MKKRILAALLMCAAALAVCGGCAAYDLQVHSDAAARPEWRVLTFPPDDNPAGTSARDFSVHGGTGGQGCGAEVRSRVACALQGQHGFVPVSDGDFSLALSKARLSIIQTAALPPDRAAALARAAGADMFVTGRVQRYESWWILFVPWARVSFTLEGRTVEGTPLWRLSAADGGLFQSEQHVLSKIGERAAIDLAARLVEP